MPQPPDDRRPDDSVAPPPPSPPIKAWSDTHTLITDAIQRALQTGVPFRDKRDQARAASYMLIGTLQGKASEAWLDNVEKRLDEIELEATTVSPERDGVTSMQVGRDVAATQRFPPGTERFFTEREDEIIAQRAYDRIVPILRELIGAGNTHGVLEWKIPMPTLRIATRGEPEERPEPVPLDDDGDAEADE